MRKTVVLFVDHATGWGGAEHSLFLLLTHLDPQYILPHLAAPPAPLLQRARQQNIPVHPLTFPRLRGSPRFLSDVQHGARQLARLARDLNVSLIYGNTVRGSLYAALAARMAHLPFVWHMRDFWLSETAPTIPLLDQGGKRLLCAAADRIIANSYATAQHLPCSRKVSVIYNGIELRNYVPGYGGAAFRKQHHIPPRAPLIGTVGRLRPWKGHDRFLRVLAQVRNAHPDVWGLIIGGTPLGEGDAYPRQLREEAQRLGLTSRLIFTGHLEDVRPALDAMDVFVHAGDPEPFGMAVVEAMAMQTPIVAFAHGALPEIIRADESGILVPPGHLLALAHAIIGLLQDENRRLEMAHQARTRAQFFTIERTAENIQELLLSLARA